MPFLLTHPLPQERIDRLELLANRQIQPNKPSYQRFFRIKLWLQLKNNRTELLRTKKQKEPQGSASKQSDFLYQRALASYCLNQCSSQSIADIKKSISLVPLSLEARVLELELMICASSQKTHDIKKAHASLQEALSFWPRSISLRLLQGRLALLLGDSLEQQNAMDALLKLAKKAPHERAFWLMILRLSDALNSPNINHLASLYLSLIQGDLQSVEAQQKAFQPNLPVRLLVHRWLLRFQNKTALIPYDLLDNIVPTSSVH